MSAPTAVGMTSLSLSGALDFNVCPGLELLTLFSSSVKQGVRSSPGVSKLQPADQTSPMPVFLSDILLEHSHARCFMYSRGCLLLVAAGTIWPHKT